MATHDRPSGLTALATINLVFSAVEALWALFSIFAIYILFVTNHPGAAPGGGNPIAEVSLGLMVTATILQLLCATFLFVSGIGFLKQSRRFGLWVGNAYATTGLALSVVLAGWMPRELEGQISIGLVRNIFYPLFIAYLVNCTFRRDLKQ